MDRVGIFGIIIAIGSILIAQIIAGGTPVTLIDFPAFLIVVGGTFGAVIIQTPIAQFKHAMNLLVTLFNTPTVDTEAQISKIHKWSADARTNGFLALENIADTEEDPFIRKGLVMLVDGADTETLRYVMEQELDIQLEHMERSARVFEAMGGYSPTIGIIGAVLGLIQAMSHLNDPTLLGSGIAVAFVATIYGVGFANLIYLPVGNRIRAYNYQFGLEKEMALEGLIAIANGENSLSIERRMHSFNLGFRL